MFYSLSSKDSLDCAGVASVIINSPVYFVRANESSSRPYISLAPGVADNWSTICPCEWEYTAWHSAAGELCVQTAAAIQTQCPDHWGAQRKVHVGRLMVELQSHWFSCQVILHKATLLMFYMITCAHTHTYLCFLAYSEPRVMCSFTKKHRTDSRWHCAPELSYGYLKISPRYKPMSVTNWSLQEDLKTAEREMATLEGKERQLSEKLKSTSSKLRAEQEEVTVFTYL